MADRGGFGLGNWGVAADACGSGAVWSDMLSSVLVLGLALVSGANEPVALRPGVAAPGLSVRGWAKGTPGTSFARDRVTLVEFWATWCGPCWESMPHLSELQAKYGERLDVVAVAVWQQDVDPLAAVTEFVKTSGIPMEFRVAVDDESGTMARTWLGAAQRKGIPATFLVKDGVVQWIGMPFDVDEPLAALVAGRFDVRASARAFEESLVQGREDEKTQAAIAAALRTAEQDWRAGLAALDGIRPGPAVASYWASVRLGLIAEHDPAGLREAVLAILARPETASGVAQFVSLATRREQLTPAILDAGRLAVSRLSGAERWSASLYVGQALLAAGERAEAKAMLEAALAEVPETGRTVGLRGQLRATLRQLEGSMQLSEVILL